MYKKKEVRTMDSFLKEIDTELLKRWLLNQNEDDWDVKEVNDNIVIETKYGLGTIRNLSSGCKTLLFILIVLLNSMLKIR